MVCTFSSESMAYVHPIYSSPLSTPKASPSLYSPACQTRVCQLVQLNKARTRPTGLADHKVREVARIPQ